MELILLKVQTEENIMIRSQVYKEIMIIFTEEISTSPFECHILLH